MPTAMEVKVHERRKLNSEGKYIYSKWYPVLNLWFQKVCIGLYQLKPKFFVFLSSFIFCCIMCSSSESSDSIWKMERDSSINPWLHLVVHLIMKCLLQKEFTLLSVFHKDICRAVHFISLFETLL